MAEGKLTYQQKLEKLMNYIHDSALWTNTFGDINLGACKEMEADTNHKIMIPMPEEKMYNSVMVFSILAALQKPRATLLYEGSCGNGKTTLAEVVGHFLYSDCEEKVAKIDCKEDPAERSEASTLEKEISELIGQPSEYKLFIDYIKEAKIQCHPEQTEEKMIARLDTGELIKHGKEKVSPRKFITCPIHVLDEINRLPQDKADIIYNMIDRGRVKYMDVLLTLAEGPIYATRNYNRRDEGTYDMAPPFLDRFELSVLAPVPNAQDFEVITNYHDETLEDRLGVKIDPEPKAEEPEKLEKLKEDLRFTAEDREKIWQEMKNIGFTKDARNFIHYFFAQINFCMGAVSPEYNKCAPAFMNKGSCRNQLPDALCKSGGSCHYYSQDSICRLTKNELSVRSVKSTYKYSGALAWLAGRKEVDVEIVKNVLPYTIGHKLEPTNVAFTENENQNFKNDTVGFVNMLLEKADKGFNEAGEIFKSWGSIVNAYERVIKGEMKPEDLIDKVTVHGVAEMAKYDDPVKYSIMLWCQRIYHFVLNKYDIRKK